MKKYLTLLFFGLVVLFSFININATFAWDTAGTGSVPYSLVLDNEGNIYTANLFSNNVSKITPTGASSIFATTGNRPISITIDGDGNLYTANNVSNNVSKITPDGTSTILGTTGSTPQGIYIDSLGNIYTTNAGSQNVSKITPDGTSTILGTTENNPGDMIMDGDGNLYVVNSSSDSVSKITPAGNSTVFSSTGSNPRAITKDSDGNFYVANRNSDNISKITTSGVSSVFVSQGAEPILDGPFGITIDEDDNLYVLNFSSRNVTKITPDLDLINMGSVGEGPVELQIDNNENIFVVNSAGNNITKISNPLHDAGVNSNLYSVFDATETIENVPFNTPKADFLSNITKNNEAQTFDDTDISDPVVTGDTLVVTAEDGVTTATYTITVDPEVSHDATISSEAYTVTINGNEGTIKGVPSDTSLNDFLNNLTKGNENQWLDYDDSGSVNDPVQDGDILVVWAEDGETNIVYTVTVNPDLYWYNSGADTNWNTLTGNWWTDSSHTVQADALPTREDSTKTLGTVGPVVDLDGDWEEPESIDATDTGITFTSTENAQLTTDLTGNATFNGTVRYNATLDGNATFNDTTRNVSFHTVLGNATFNDSSSNAATVAGNAIFNDSSTNSISGEVQGYACFRDESTNEGDVGSLLCPPIVLTSPTTLIAQTTVTLNGEITDDGGEDASHVGFQYGTTTEYGAEVSEEGEYGTGTFSLNVEDLTCGTTYHFRAYGTNDFDTTYSEDSTFTTSPCADEETPTNHGSSSGSTKRTIKTPTLNTEPTTCLPGQKYNTETGKPCTTYTNTPTPSNTCSITLTLKQGYRGEQVKCLQTKLNILSDGIFGPMTKNAVILFQKSKNLVPDGIVGPKTREEMR